MADYVSGKSIGLASGAFVGAVVQALIKRVTWGEAGVSLFAALAVGYFLGRPAAEALVSLVEPDDPESIWGAVGVIIGLGGRALASVIIEAWRNPMRSVDALIALLQRLRG